MDVFLSTVEYHRWYRRQSFYLVLAAIFETNRVFNCFVYNWKQAALSCLAVTFLVFNEMIDEKEMMSELWSSVLLETWLGNVSIKVNKVLIGPELVYKEIIWSSTDSCYRRCFKIPLTC